MTGDMRYFISFLALLMLFITPTGAGKLNMVPTHQLDGMFQFGFSSGNFDEKGGTEIITDMGAEQYMIKTGEYAVIGESGHVEIREEYGKKFNHTFRVFYADGRIEDFGYTSEYAGERYEPISGRIFKTGHASNTSIVFTGKEALFEEIKGAGGIYRPIYSGKLIILEPSGTTYVVPLNEVPSGRPHLLDIDNSGFDEILYPKYKLKKVDDAYVYVNYLDVVGLIPGPRGITIKGVDGWPKEFSESITPTEIYISTGDVDLDGNIEIAAVDTIKNKVYLFSNKGKLRSGWPNTFEGNLYGPPIFADLDCNGGVEIISATANGKIYVHSPLGGPIKGWPKQLGEPIRTIMVGDLTPYGGMELSVITDYNIYILDDRGNILKKWPHIKSKSGAALLDISGDGYLDVLIASSISIDGYGWEGDLIFSYDQYGSHPKNSFGINDYDGDGYLDLEVATYYTINIAPTNVPVTESARSWLTEGHDPKYTYMLHDEGKPLECVYKEPFTIPQPAPELLPEEITCAPGERLCDQKCISETSCCADDECEEDQICVNNMCRIKMVCGDGKCHWADGETEETCCRDCGCTDGVCQLYLNKCVQCNKDEMCRLGEVCDSERGICLPLGGCLSDEDCPSRIDWSGIKVCSGDHKRLEEIGIKKSSSCIAKTCKYDDLGQTTKVLQDCTMLGTYCQDGKCGCSEGYSVCQETGGCMKERALRMNAPCKCNFQCDSGYCHNEICMTPLEAILSASESSVKAGGETQVTLSVDNTLDNAIETNILLKVGAGGRIAGVPTGQSCAGNQCKVFKKIGPKESEDVTILLSSVESTTVQVTGAVTYKLGDKLYVMDDLGSAHVHYYVCGNGQCESGESIDNCPKDCGVLKAAAGLGGSYLIAFAVGVFAFILSFGVQALLRRK